MQVNQSDLRYTLIGCWFGNKNDGGANSSRAREIGSRACLFGRMSSRDLKKDVHFFARNNAENPFSDRIFKKNGAIYYPLA